LRTKNHEEVRELVKEYEQSSEAIIDALITLSVYGEVPYSECWNLTDLEIERFRKILKEKSDRTQGKKPVEML